ncbi:LytTR family transcriptional regulator DNA-binding domain-containing protein [Sandarakinorhabdus sp.]|uniref:LytTR family DNA-binding domain-containing protein n=1 Tax=Sandarakinorhabdus sp. TaxID=1916663 RepID=UPI00286EA157|nr:LytTR family transcriptional regulator DNA-binding domain-containing protein [Sandarakinorhabdus sp.]
MKSTHPMTQASAAPPLRPLVVATGVAVIACTLAGPFGTDHLPALSRGLFWLVLIGWNSVKWRLWYAWIGPRAPGRRGAIMMAIGGTALLNATLPLEIDTMFRAIGRPLALSWTGLYLSALIIGGGISTIIAAIKPLRTQPPQMAPTEMPAKAAPQSQLAQRAGLADLSGLLWVQAEDHYLRLGLADGRRPLVLFRLGDALGDLAVLDGLQIHRSAWVAAAAVSGTLRDGRRWKLRLSDGSDLPVSETYLPEVRARGWLARR